MTYTQCKLRRGITQQTAWIPSEFAVRDRYVRIRNEDGWRVISVGGTQSAEYVREHERDFRHQRQASDI
jgi:hypothetical protein